MTASPVLLSSPGDLLFVKRQPDKFRQGPAIFFREALLIMKSWLYLILAIFVTFAFLGCAALTSYPPGYQPSEWETSIAPPDWYLNEGNGPLSPETVN
jgi:hypothetical protein